jgi:hypothetical protein
MIVDIERTDEGPPIRVVTANLSDAIAESVTRTIRQQADMVLVDEVQGMLELLLAVDEGVHVVVLGAPQPYPLPAICTHLLGEYPHLRIVVVGTNCNKATTYWLGLRRRSLGTFSTRKLVNGIRRAHRVNPTA